MCPDFTVAVYAKAEDLLLRRPQEPVFYQRRQCCGLADASAMIHRRLLDIHARAQ